MLIRRLTRLSVFDLAGLLTIPSVKQEKDRARQWFDPNNNRKSPNLTIYRGPVINAGGDVHVNKLQTNTRKRLLEDESSDDEIGSTQAVDNKRSKGSNPPSVSYIG